MTLRQFWAVLYTLVLDDLRHEFDNAYLAAAVARAAGAEVEMPSWSQTRAEFDEFLFGEPDPVDAGRQTQLAALGLR